MYKKYFGLSELPFTIAPDPRYLYLSAEHREALASLLYGINCNGGFVLLTGEIGTGKTTVCRCLLEQIPDSAEIAFILNPKYSISELLEAICDELKIRYDRSENRIKGYIDALNGHLLESHARGVNTVLIIDEAQNLSLDALEQIRLLTNLETSSEKLLQIILIGQPELLEQLSRQQLRQLNQRITARYHLHALNPSELREYVSHRLAVSGCEAPLFTPGALRTLHRLTHGVPRMVNIICDRALLGAYVERRRQVDSGVLRRAAAEVLGRGSETSGGVKGWLRRWMTWPTAAVLLLALGWWLPGAAGDGWWPRLQAMLASAPTPTNTLIPAAEAKPPVAEAVQSKEAPSAEPSAAAVPAPAPQQPAETVTPEGVVEPIDPEPLPVDIAAQPQVSAAPRVSSPGDWQWPEGTDLGATAVLAYRALFRSWGLSYDPQAAPQLCSFARAHNLSCLSQPGGVNELLQYNLPAVLDLFNARGQGFQAALIGIDRSKELAHVEIAGEQRWVALSELRTWMSGARLLLWRMPPGYNAPLRPEERGPLVPWLENNLARLQGKPMPAATRQRYDEPLQLQVLAFQHQNSLQADGVVGPQTIIQLSALTESGIPLLSSTARE
ncbi:AAA family ATPase [Pseudomonas sp. MAP12]|uniref:AAA family ATPase n=2 Tax=Geopseudomonas aromaticivorans TaxID=2849492 RepID=A0ABS6MS32_9GAMM|nr:AAA family ATPase [Pseudomonas aromaticivorans]